MPWAFAFPPALPRIGGARLRHARGRRGALAVVPAPGAVGIGLARLSPILLLAGGCTRLLFPPASTCAVSRHLVPAIHPGRAAPVTPAPAADS